jgi:hypothetical protein
MVPQLNTIAGVNYDILAYSDVTFALTLTFKDGSGNPIVKTGSSFLFTVRPSLTPGSEYSLQFSTDDGDITIGGDGNNVVTITADLGISGGNYFYELQETDTNGNSLAPIYGRMFITKSATTP